MVTEGPPKFVVQLVTRLLSDVVDLTLGDLDTVVYNESDRLFEMGFATQVRDIVRSAPSTQQSMLFSATMPASLVEFARVRLRDPEVIRLVVGASVGTCAPSYGL